MHAGIISQSNGTGLQQKKSQSTIHIYMFVYLIGYVIILNKNENHYLYTFLCLCLSSIATGVQMTLEMLEKRFWSIATQVLKHISNHLLQLQFIACCPLHVYFCGCIHVLLSLEKSIN